jgi:hypothetical protein
LAFETLQFNQAIRAAAEKLIPVCGVCCVTGATLATAVAHKHKYGHQRGGYAIRTQQPLRKRRLPTLQLYALFAASL